MSADMSQGDTTATQGGLCLATTYNLSAMHRLPKPRAILDVNGMSEWHPRSPRSPQD